MLRVPLEAFRGAFEGVIPSMLCTVSADGIPNVTSLSLVSYIDSTHVGLSFQFFNKTKRNVLENPKVQALVIEPTTLRQMRLDLVYERTEVEGDRFERMKTRLEAIESGMGIGGLFRLRGTDIYRVVATEEVATRASEQHAPAAPQRDALLALELFSARLSETTCLDGAVSVALEALAELFDYPHALLLCVDESRERLCTLAAHGYDPPAISSEAIVGEGPLGMAAARRTPVRVNHLGRDRRMARAMRDEIRSSGGADKLAREVPLPGLPNVQSQLVVPLVAADRLMGVLCVESATPGRFGLEDERLLGAAGRLLGATMALFEGEEEHGAADPEPAQEARSSTTGPPLRMRHHACDDSVFADDEYVIKGVAGAVLWKLLKLHGQTGRTAFTTRELRLDPALGLPPVKDNLDTRLLLLRRRLGERDVGVRLERAGRGRLRLVVDSELVLDEEP